MLKGIASKEILAPSHKREAVAHLQTLFEVSQRRACDALGVDRTTVRYQSRRPDDAEARERMCVLGADHTVDGGIRNSVYGWRWNIRPPGALTKWSPKMTAN